MRTPIPIEKIAFAELFSAAKKSSMTKVTLPQVQILSPKVPATTPQLIQSSKYPITLNHIFICLIILAAVSLVLYLKSKQSQSERVYSKFEL